MKNYWKGIFEERGCCSKCGKICVDPKWVYIEINYLYACSTTHPCMYMCVYISTFESALKGEICT